MRRLSVFLMLLLVVSFQILYAGTITYTYTFSPLKKVDNNGFRVCIKFKAESIQSTFDFPMVWGSENIKEYIHVDTITGVSDYSIMPGGPQKLKMQHVKGSTVNIYYTLGNTVEGKTFLGGDTFFPLINEDHFYFFSNSVMLVPETDDLCNFSLEWMDYPSSYKNSPITSIGSGYQQSLKSVKPVSFQNLLIAGGDYRVYEKKLGEKEIIKLFIRGKWNFTDSSMMEMVRNTIHHQRLFWNDHSTPLYSIIVEPVFAASENELSFQGTGLLNSFSVAVTENRNASPHTLGYLLHHELMHHWIGSKIQNGRDEELSYWFSEGFTDYFARMNMFHCGLMNKDEYIHTLDSLFALHYSNPLRESHNDSIKIHFWDDRMYGKLPYDRGALFAYYLDLLIQNKTEGKKSLKNVMQNMLRQALKKPQPFDTAWFTREVKKISGENISSEIKRFMIKGDFIPVEMWNNASPGLLEIKELKVYDLGFGVNTGEMKKGSVVTFIKPLTGAEGSGLKEGDIIQGFSIYYGRLDYEAELNVLRNGAGMDIKFYPFLNCRVPQHIK